MISLTKSIFEVLVLQLQKARRQPLFAFSALPDSPFSSSPTCNCSFSFYLTDSHSQFCACLGLSLSLHVCFLKTLSLSLLSQLSEPLPLGLLLTEFKWKSLDAINVFSPLSHYHVSCKNSAKSTHVYERENRSLVKTRGLCHVALMSP